MCNLLSLTTVTPASMLFSQRNSQDISRQGCLRINLRKEMHTSSCKYGEKQLCQRRHLHTTRSEEGTVSSFIQSANCLFPWRVTIQNKSISNWVPCRSIEVMFTGSSPVFSASHLVHFVAAPAQTAGKTDSSSRLFP